MGIVESIGWIVIIFGSFYLLLGYISGKERRKRDLQELIQNNSKCQELISKETKIIYGINGKILRIDSNQIFNFDGDIIDPKLKKELLRIINDPVEKQYALENIRKKQERLEKSKQESLDRERNNRKVGYKYELEIFEIFDNRREIPKIELLQSIEEKFKVNDDKAVEIFQLWKDNMLIDECDWNKNNIEVGWTLVWESVIDNNDLTWDKWLKQKGISLVPESKEYLDYIKK